MDNGIGDINGTRATAGPKRTPCPALALTGARCRARYSAALTM
jgi:hypothetical protein